VQSNRLTSVAALGPVAATLEELYERRERSAAPSASEAERDGESASGVFCGGGASEASEKKVLFCGVSGQAMGLEGARARRRYSLAEEGALLRRERASDGAVGGRPPEPPLRPARSHRLAAAGAGNDGAASLAHVLGCTGCIGAHMHAPPSPPPPSLARRYLASNGIDDEGLSGPEDGIGAGSKLEFPNLTVLDLSKNKITLLSHFASLKSLDDLWFSENGVASFDEVSLLKDVGLETIYLEHNPVARDSECVRAKRAQRSGGASEASAKESWFLGCSCGASGSQKGRERSERKGELVAGLLVRRKRVSEKGLSGGDPPNPPRCRGIAHALGCTCARLHMRSLHCT
jgi:hypothetical protein